MGVLRKMSGYNKEEKRGWPRIQNDDNPNNLYAATNVRIIRSVRKTGNEVCAMLPRRQTQICD